MHISHQCRDLHISFTYQYHGYFQALDNHYSIYNNHFPGTLSERMIALIVYIFLAVIDTKLVTH